MEERTRGQGDPEKEDGAADGHHRIRNRLMASIRATRFRLGNVDSSMASGRTLRDA